jgi:hypothetical protein
VLSAFTLGALQGGLHYMHENNTFDKQGAAKLLEFLGKQCELIIYQDADKKELNEC